MKKDDRVYAGHMLDMARSAISKIQDQPRAVYDADDNLQLALTHLIQMIGEASSQVSTQTQDRHPELPWKKIIAMRHRVVHDYLHVDLDIVWDVVTVELEPLIENLEKMMPSE
ncbi:MAG: DUF86 domain-containing protein [Phycisphaerae bacterium]